MSSNSICNDCSWSPILFSARNESRPNWTPLSPITITINDNSDDNDSDNDDDNNANNDNKIDEDSENDNDDNYSNNWLIIVTP